MPDQPSRVPPFETVLHDITGGVATVTLNRPKVLNALNARVLDELEQTFAALRDDRSVHVILLTGSGEKAFAAGADIHELADADAASGERLALRGQAVFRAVESCGKPVLACINGFALGGGCELALACTLRIASETARLGQPEIRLGIMPGYGGTQRLPRLIGPAAALKMILTGAMVDAAEAWRLGLVDEVVPAEALLDRAMALAHQIAAMPPLAVAGCLEAVTRGAGLPLDDALAIEAGIFGRICGTDDKREGVAAFLEKRSATWTGR